MISKLISAFGYARIFKEIHGIVLGDKSYKNYYDSILFDLSFAFIIFSGLLPINSLLARFIYISIHSYFAYLNFGANNVSAGAGNALIAAAAIYSNASIKGFIWITRCLLTLLSPFIFYFLLEELSDLKENSTDVLLYSGLYKASASCIMGTICWPIRYFQIMSTIFDVALLVSMKEIKTQDSVALLISIPLVLFSPTIARISFSIPNLYLAKYFMIAGCFVRILAEDKPNINNSTDKSHYNFINKISLKNKQYSLGY